MRETILFLYIDEESDCELKHRTDIWDLTQDEMHWATVVILFIYFEQKFPFEHLKDDVHQQVIHTCSQCLHSEQLSILGLYENTGSISFSHLFHFPLFHFLFFNFLSIWENVNLQEMNLCIYATAACLPTVCPVVSLRRKTCVLWQSDSVFLMAYCVWTKKLNFVFSVALLPVFFYTQQVLFY